MRAGPPPDGCSGGTLGQGGGPGRIKPGMFGVRRKSGIGPTAMSGRYFFMVNEPPDEDRPIPEIAMTDASGNPVDVWHFFRGETYSGEPVPVGNMPTDR